VECDSIIRFSGATNNNAWLGTVNGSDNAYYVNSNGNVNNNNNQTNTYVVAPALPSARSGLRIWTVGKGFRIPVFCRFLQG
jgi:hypothetical protein